ncbi:hypothetical protein E0198_003389 [Clavispora lusitaniae]|nr:hypothetical protein E0198_003389 [Clavispora lusitaniae]
MRSTIPLVRAGNQLQRNNMIMGEQSENSRSVGVLINLLSSHVTESSTQIKALSQAAKTLVSPGHEEQLRSSEPCQTISNFTESDLIVELEKSRLALETEIQWQDFATTKLTELISDSDELVRNVTKHYTEADKRQQEEEKEMNQRTNYYVNATIGDKIDQLDANISSLSKSLAIVTNSASETLQKFDLDEQLLLSNAYEKEMAKLVELLNGTFNNEVHKSI